MSNIMTNMEGVDVERVEHVRPLLLPTLEIDMMTPSSSVSVVRRHGQGWCRRHGPIRVVDRQGCRSRLRHGQPYLTPSDCD